jgi:hypothetical protein
MKRHTLNFFDRSAGSPTGRLFSHQQKKESFLASKIFIIFMVR